MVTVQPALARARAALERGHGAAAADLLAPVLHAPALSRDDELAIRCALAEAWLLRDDINKASTALGRQPDVLREPLSPARLAALWRLHGRIAFARGDQSRAIALHVRSLKQAELAHDSRAIGLAHYELGLCYKQVGDAAIVREHIDRAAPALHAAGDRRHLALLHSLSGVSLAQSGRMEEAMAALRQAERLAAAVAANDVLGIVFNNQAIVALSQHRHEQALTLAERSAVLQESVGGRGLAIALATLGQICVRLGDFERADQVLHRALEVRSTVQYHEITGAVYDSLAQIHMMRGAYEAAGDYLRRASDAYASYGRQTSQWYEWSIRVLEAKLALHRGSAEAALRLADELTSSPSVPPGDALQADLIASEALLAAGRFADAEKRLVGTIERVDPREAPGAWAECLRLRGELCARTGRATEAYHNLAQSANMFELLAERYQAALSYLALGRLAASTRSRLHAERHLDRAAAIFESLGARRDLEEARSARQQAADTPLIESPASPVDADDALVRRLVDAAVLPALLGRETAAAMREVTDADASVVFVQPKSGDLRVLGRSGCSAETARTLAHSQNGGNGEWSAVERLGHDLDGPRLVLVVGRDQPTDRSLRKLRLIAAVARQGFDLCAARERPIAAAEHQAQRSLEPLLPGFLVASPPMLRVAEQIQRLQGNDLTVLITGESGTGKELVARAIHAGSLRSAGVFLPYNCTTTTRELADSQLFGHRRGSFTGAVSDQQGLVRAAGGGTLFLDEIGDIPLDVQPKLLRFLEQGEIMPVGETRPQRVDVRVVAATNADLEQRVAEGKFREDLYYRLSVIRLQIPPLRDRREEIPYLSSLFVREASERLGKPDIQLGSETLELFAQYWWPGNVRQLRNEIQRAVAMSAPGGTIRPEHLSADMLAPPSRPTEPGARRSHRVAATNLASAVDDLERDLIQSALGQSGGNISEAARVLGLTRRGLYLKLRRLGLESREMDTM